KCSIVERIADCRTIASDLRSVNVLYRTPADRTRLPPETSIAKPGDAFVEAFAKGLAVIVAFDGAKRSLSIAEVAERAHLPRAGARRLLYTLVQLGYARSDGNRFELTPKIIGLGRAFLASAMSYDLARPIVESLSRDTGELCTMSILDGTDVV